MIDMVVKFSAFGMKNPLGIRLIAYFYLLGYGISFTFVIVAGILLGILGGPINIYDLFYWGAASAIGYLLAYGLMANRTWAWWLAMIESVASISLQTYRFVNFGFSANLPASMPQYITLLATYIHIASLAISVAILLYLTGPNTRNRFKAKTGIRIK